MRRPPGAPARAASGFVALGAFPWLSSLAAHLSAVREEALGVIERYRYLRWRHPEIYTSDPRGVVGQRATFYLEVYGMAVRRNQTLCPRTVAALADVPGLVTAGFYLLDARSRILPHRGPTDAMLRAHMGVICPTSCHLRVGAETRAWTEGGVLVFDDMIEHEARNDSDEMRAILMVDFLRDADAVERRDEILAGLRQALLKPHDHPWLLAGDIAADGAFADALSASPQARAQAESLRAMVAQSGLYFP